MEGGDGSDGGESTPEKLPNLESLSLGDDELIQLRVDRVERVAALNETNVFVVLLAPRRPSRSRLPQQPGGRRRAARGGGDDANEWESNGRLLPLFLPGALDGEGAMAVLRAGPPATLGEPDLARGTLGRLFDWRYLQRVAFFYRRFSKVLTQLNQLRDVLRRAPSTSNSPPNAFTAFLERMRMPQRYATFHELLLEVVESTLDADVVQVVLKAPPGQAQERMSALLCMEMRGPVRQPWFIRLRASDGALLAYLRSCPLLIEEGAWRGAALAADAVPLGESVTFPKM